jgi:type I restriction enzyme R subunit
VFGNYVDIYDISQAVEDGATVRIFYESRLAKIAISEEGKELIEDFDDQFTEDDLNQHKKSVRSGQESKDSLVVKNVSKRLPKTS